MLALAIPLAIFVLPVFAKHLHCSWDPIELLDGAVPCSLVGENIKSRKNNSESDEGADETQTLSTPDPVLGSCVKVEVSMDGVQDGDETESAEVETMQGLNSNESSKDSVDLEYMSVESPGLINEIEMNGAVDPSMPRLSKTPSPGAENARGANSKVASLRAAFERADKPSEEVKKRLISGDGTTARNIDVGREHETEIVRLKNELEKEKDLRIAYEEKVTSLEDEIEELNSQLEDQDEAWRAEYERRQLQERNEAETRLNTMASEARSQRLEASTLQKQLVELKRSVSTSTRTTTQVSDTNFREEIATLQHEIQNWVVNNFRRVKVESPREETSSRLEQVAPTSRLELIQQIYRRFEPAAKLPIYQATLVCYLMEIFADPYLYGLSSELAWAERSREAAEALCTILPVAVYNRWRAVTFDALRQIKSVKELVESAAFNVAKNINVTLDAVTELEADDARLTSLKTIVKRVIEIAHLIRVQQAQYNFNLPSPGDRFDAASMDDISEDSDFDTERTVLCATFPSIVKLGDENGDHLDTMNLIVKAQVLCSDSEP